MGGKKPLLIGLIFVLMLGGVGLSLWWGAGSSEAGGEISTKRPSSATQVTVPPEQRGVDEPITGGTVSTLAEFLAAVAKYQWQTGGRAVQSDKEGVFIVLLPATIPDAIKVEPITIPAMADLPADSEALMPPTFLRPDEADLYRELVSEGQSVVLVKGGDGYLHIKR